MYSVVMMAAMTAAPQEPGWHLCPVSPSVYGVSIWSHACFLECCLPARYGWTPCGGRGYSSYPTGWGFGGCCGWGHGNHHYNLHRSGGCYGLQSCYGGTWMAVPAPEPLGALYPGVFAPPLGGIYTAPPVYNPIYTPGTPDSGGGVLPKPIDSGIPGLPPIPAPPPGGLDKDPVIPPAKKDSKTDLGRPMPAVVTLNVPEASKVYVDGHALRASSAERSFRTPAVEPGQEFYYTVRVVAEVDGREVTETKKVLVSAGQTVRVSFDEVTKVPV